MGREYIVIHRFAVLLIKMRLVRNNYHAMHIYAAMSDTQGAAF